MSIYIVSGIIALLILLVGYAFIAHALEKRRVQRLRLLNALKGRERNFKYMITGLPANFLPAELSSLIYRALIETCEQLAKLEPKEPYHRADASQYTAQMSTLNQAPGTPRVRLENPTQIKEVREQLQELFRFVAQQEHQQQINKVQAAAYGDQIKRLALQISVDNYVMQARLAQQQSKRRLAVHFYSLARKQLSGANANHNYDKQIAQLQTIITKLEEAPEAQSEQSEQSKSTAKITNKEQGPISKEWEQFGEEDEWKKKQVYD